MTHNLAAWGPLVERLPEDAHVIALDFRSHGDSENAGDHHYTDYVADVMTAIESTGAQRPLIVGHSWGARVALYLAATRPEVPRAVLAMDQALWDHDIRVPASTDVPDEVLPDDEHSELISEYEREWPRWAELVRRMYVRCPGGWMQRFRVVDGAALIAAEYSAQPVEHLYQQIQCPVTLAFANDESGEFGFAPQQSRDLNIAHLRDTFTHLTCVMVPGEHGFYGDNPDDVIRVIADLEDRT